MARNKRSAIAWIDAEIAIVGGGVMGLAIAAIIWPAAAPKASGRLAGTEWRIVEVHGAKSINGFLWAGFYALLAMVLVLVLDFGTVKHMAVSLLPLAMGMIVTLGVMTLLGQALNPANMIAFPLILGVGADNGVHVMHDYRGRRRGRR